MGILQRQHTSDYRVKVLKNQLNLAHDLKENPTGCLLMDASAFEVLLCRDERGGSYIVWDKVLSKWVRTEKAVATRPRKA